MERSNLCFPGKRDGIYAVNGKILSCPLILFFPFPRLKLSAPQFLSDSDDSSKPDKFISILNFISYPETCTSPAVMMNPYFSFGGPSVSPSGDSSGKDFGISYCFPKSTTSPDIASGELCDMEEIAV